LLKLAHRLGHKTKNGETMLLMQGVKAFEIWTGKKAPVNVMRKALKDAI
jgi:shikimate dehydrogenase